MNNDFLLIALICLMVYFVTGCASTNLLDSNDAAADPLHDIQGVYRLTDEEVWQIHQWRQFMLRQPAH